MRRVAEEVAAESVVVFAECKSAMDSGDEQGMG